MEFFDWTMLGGSAGAATAVGVLTQLTKEIPGISRIPTQLWSYILALLILLLAMVFNGGFTAQGATLSVFNAAVVSLAANGGYSALRRATTRERGFDERWD